MTENPKSNELSKFPSIVWSASIYNILVSITILALLIIKQKTIHEVFADQLGINDLLFISIYTITSLIGLAGGIGLILRKSWAWYSILFLIVLTTVGQILGSTIVLLMGLYNPFSFLIRNGILLLLAVPLTKTFMSDRVKQIYQIKQENSWVLKRVLGLAFILQILIQLLAYFS